MLIQGVDHDRPILVRLDLAAASESRVELAVPETLHADHDAATAGIAIKGPCPDYIAAGVDDFG